MVIKIAPWKGRTNMTIEKRYKDDTGSWNTVNEKAESLKKFIRKTLLTIFLLSLVTFVFLVSFNPPLPQKDVILDKIIHQEPYQNKEIIEQQIITKGDYRYKVIPQYSYELYGLVVSQYNSENFLDVRHKKDPAQIKDLCVVWGDNIVSGIYKDIEYKSGEFTCYAKPKEGVDWSAFSMQNLSNNHLVPADDEIADKIRKANIADQVYIKGYLSSYEIYDINGDLISSRGTSIKREDSGNGACETIFVTDFEILKGKNYLYRYVRDISGITAVFSFLALAVVILFL
ncbi:hypothetical protein JXA63_01035 [Candidatus Woesebacteria bacterium]|nr:hypothetical protein [Candidatus Woesebacteria bacterium]